LHAPVLLRLRDSYPELFAAHPIVGFDPGIGKAFRDGLTVRSLEQAAMTVPPADTVVHVCTPPGVRVPVLARLAGLGFRRFVVEKPLAADPGALDGIERLRAAHGLDIVVVTQWLAATLTRRLDEVVRSGRFGPLRSIGVRQDKSRFGRSHNGGHADAFDVEIPHALAVALALAGPARLTGAGRPEPALGPLAGAWLSVRHGSGVHTTIRSDLTSPVRRREITLRLRDTTVVGHYPVSADDHHAQLRVGASPREVFEDESLGAFLLAAYRYFAGVAPAPPGEFAPHARMVRLLAEARALAGQDVAAHAG
jgi:hypothetical protein